MHITLTSQTLSKEGTMIINGIFLTNICIKIVFICLFYIYVRLNLLQIPVIYSAKKFVNSIQFISLKTSKRLYNICTLPTVHPTISMLDNNQITLMQSSIHAQTGKKIKNYVYEYQDLIGKGNFAKVYKGHSLTTHQILAIKLISLNELKNKHLETLAFEEIGVLQMMDHPNILRFVEALLSQRNCYIVTELCNQGSLDDRIKSRIPLSENQLGSIIFDLFNGLKYLREKGVIHRDLKPANIFVKDGKMKIADFGLAKFYKQRFHDLDIGSPLYMSPEGLILNNYSQKTDIWSLGITIYELLHGTTPFIDCQTQQELLFSITLPIPEHKWRRDINPSLRKMLNRLLQINEYKRPNIYQLADEPYMRMLIELQNQKNREVRVGRSMSLCGFMDCDLAGQKMEYKDGEQVGQRTTRNISQKIPTDILYSTKGSQNSIGQNRTSLQSTQNKVVKQFLPKVVDKVNQNRFSFAKTNQRNKDLALLQNLQRSTNLQPNHHQLSTIYSFSERQMNNSTHPNQNHLYTQNQLSRQNMERSTLRRQLLLKQQYNNHVPFVCRMLHFN